ncbi:MAG: trypsin-like peptidase domain-containing protein [Lacipirellulaceae bacterium]
MRTTLLLLFGVLVSPQAWAVVWRADLNDPPAEQTGHFRSAGRLSYTPLQVFGGSCVWIKERWVLTARHAVAAWKPAALTVDFPGSGKQRYDVKSIYLPLDKQVDLAIIELSDVPELDKPLPLLKEKLTKDQQIKFGGYGLFGPAGTKQGLNRFHWGENEIDSANGKIARFSLSKPPAGLPNEATVAFFDSGSPVFCEVEGKPHLAGIIIRATGAGAPNYGDQATLTCLFEHVEWIRDVTAEEKKSDR